MGRAKRVDNDAPAAASPPTAVLETRVVPISKLKPAPWNPRKISDKAWGALATSMDRFGVVEPIVWNQRSGQVVGGHQRLTVLERRGVKKATVVVVDLPESEERALNVALNNPESAGQFTDALGPILKELAASLGPETYAALAFDDLERLVPNPVRRSVQDPGAQMDRAEELQKQWDVKTGQLWTIGEHRLLCGDSTKPDEVRRLMDGQKAKWWWTDPPWNVAYGEHDHPSWKMRKITNDNLGKDFPAFIASAVARAKEVLEPGAMVYVVMSAQEWPVVDKALRDAGFHWSSTVIWKKDRLVLSRKDYHTQYEPLWYGWEDSGPRLCPLVDRQQSDVWEIDRPSSSDEHPTMKPVELIVRSLENSSRLADVGYEPFSGSGSTFVAAEQLGRRCFGMEVEPKYVAVALERLEGMGLAPTLAT